MASRQNLEKRRVWEVRLKRFRASGLTVARFCEQERVSVNTFYYWAKRVRLPAVTASLPVPHRGRRRGCQSLQPTSAAVGISDVALVRFCWNAAVEVLVPAECLGAIRCLVECLRHAPAERADAFHEVVVSS